MSEQYMPREGQAWLNAVEAALSPMDPVERLEIVDGLRAHILDALDGGSPITEVLARLGTPTDIASQAAVDADQTGEPQRAPSRYLSARRVLQFVAFALVVAAAFVIGFLPSYVATSVQEDGTVIPTTTVTGFQNLTNLGVIFVGSMVLALVITGLPLLLRGASWARASVVSAILMVLLTASAILLIGNWALTAAAIASVLAVVVPSRSSHGHHTGLRSAHA